MSETVYTLFFSIFGLITLDQLHVKQPDKFDGGKGYALKLHTYFLYESENSPFACTDYLCNINRSPSVKSNTDHLILYFAELPSVKSSLLVDRVGMLLFALYQVTVTIVLVNILIAMMSHSFDAVQVHLFTYTLEKVYI